MIFVAAGIPGTYLVAPEARGDDRGLFARTMCLNEFAAHGISGSFVQQNMSVTRHAGTVRGLHYQRAPHEEGKLVRCVRGAVLDVIVDLRADSPAHLSWAAYRLDDRNRLQLYIPPGVAHGFQTLADDVEMTYLMSEAYAPGFEGGLLHDDPVLGIRWPMPATVIADRDRAWTPIDPAAPPTL